MWPQAAPGLGGEVSRCTLQFGARKTLQSSCRIVGQEQEGAETSPSSPLVLSTPRQRRARLQASSLRRRRNQDPLQGPCPPARALSFRRALEWSDFVGSLILAEPSCLLFYISELYISRCLQQLNLKEHVYFPRASQVARWVKNLQETQEMRVQFLSREDSLEEGMATHSSILAWRIPWTEESGRLQTTGS